MDAFAVSVSFGLQYGVPLKKLVRTFTNTSFALAGLTDDPDIRTASSIVDYIFRRLALDYLSFDDRLELGLASLDDLVATTPAQTSLLEAEAPKAAAPSLAATPAPAAVSEPVAAEAEPPGRAGGVVVDQPVLDEHLVRVGFCFS